ncbi:MAG: 4Fe-4S dicluster domain-containing protein [Candidatus Hydrogenedentes bacterium]|jgi:molybdopterin-containing oxidoreductase family iron-sulfur binding subunit|nr:4Fe-4S dicluster domain-containing protein [Candidatus Hydrogenedentota bacterium]
MSDEETTSENPEAPDGAGESTGRRGFLKAFLGAALGATTTAAVVSPLRDLSDAPSLDEFFRKHYTKLTPEMMEKILKDIEVETEKDYGARVNVRDPKPIDGVEFAYALNLSRCNGSRRCVDACRKENNIPEGHSEMSYIRVLEMDIGSLDLEEADVEYDHEAVPADLKFYMPISCQQCCTSPCTRACPTTATWAEPDGIRVVDFSWCIGCRYCMAACPYEARRFNWTRPKLSPEAINPDMGYLSNRIRPRGVVEKCNFCLHRTREGKNPACLEVCPTGARVFGNLLDPKGRIRYILENKRVYVLKAEARTLPRFYYFFDK